jgi:hypothetical protein
MPRLDLLGYLPVPASARNGSGSTCCFKILGDRIIAYGSGSAVVIGDVRACVNFVFCSYTKLLFFGF